MLKKRILLLVAMLVQLSFGAEKFHFAIIGDRAGSPNQTVFASIVQDVERMHPDLVLTVGDMADNCSEKEWNLAMPEFKKLTSPVYYTPGNNDIVDNESEKLYNEKTGCKAYYSFDKEQAHFIILDNTRYEKWEDMPKEQLDWLKADLASQQKDKQIFVFMHKPFWAVYLQDKKADPLHEILKKYPVKAVFTGHWHQYAYQKIDNIDYYIIGSSGAHVSPASANNSHFGLFYQSAWVTVEPGKYDLTLIKAGNSFDKEQTTFAEKQTLDNFDSKIFTLAKSEKINATDNLLQYKLKNITDKELAINVALSSKDNWKSDKSDAKLNVLPQEETTFDFKVKQVGTYYPLPTIGFDYNLARKTIRYKSPLNLTRNVSLSNKCKVKTDGKIDKSEYGYLTTDFCDFDANASQCKTKLYVDMDENNLYLAVENFQSSPITANLKERDAEVYADDCAGMILDQNEDKAFQFYINPLGNVWDIETSLTTGEQNAKWNGNWQLKMIKTADSWGYEASIALKDLDFKADKPIKFNFRRKEIATKQTALFTPDWGLYLDRLPQIIKSDLKK